jgi:hypothetical protein
MATANPFSSCVNFLVGCSNDKATRSNFNKSLQYFTKLASIQLAENDPKSPLAKDLSLAAGAINTARKFSVLGTWFDIFNKVPKYSWGTQKDIAKNLADFLGSVFVIFDNIVVLNRIKLTDILAKDGMVGKIAMFAFWWSQFFGLLVEIMDYQALLKAHHKNKATLTPRELDEHRAKVMWCYLGFIARFGNLTYSSNGWKLSDNILGGPFSEKTCAYAGLTAGVISMFKGAMNVKKSLK